MDTDEKRLTDGAVEKKNLPPMNTDEHRSRAE
jgi:hypothetical protein